MQILTETYTGTHTRLCTMSLGRIKHLHNVKTCMACPKIHIDRNSLIVKMKHEHKHILQLNILNFQPNTYRFTTYKTKWRFPKEPQHNSPHQHQIIMLAYASKKDSTPNYNEQ